MFEKLASLGVHLPVIQAPMAGGATTPDLVFGGCHSVA
jgi:NAD(P)H-dependent flavin oxidoreductase YrpB (nitropropane dioxygenase family)